MFISADTMAYLFELGIKPEQLVELVQRLDRDAKSVQPGQHVPQERSRAAERMARYREERRERGLPASFNGNLFLDDLRARDGVLCVYCRERDGDTVDHMWPVSKGGGDELDNLALACLPCNGGKAGRMAGEGRYQFQSPTAAAAFARYCEQMRTDANTVRGEHVRENGRTEPNDVRGPRAPAIENNPLLRDISSAAASAAECAGASSDNWPEGGLSAWRDALCLIAGPGLADPAKSPGLVTTVAEIDRWRLMGCSWGQDVVPTIQGRTLKPRPNNPIGSWSLFTQDVLTAKARREAQVDIPNVIQLQATGPPSNAAAAMRAEGRKLALARYTEEDETAANH